MNLKECIPKDKYDLDAVRLATAIGFPGLGPILPDLFEWTKDGNWPVAPAVASLLSDAGIEIAPYIREILCSDDGMWKYWVILLVLRCSSAEIQTSLKSDLVRLMLHPTQDDALSDVPEVAQSVLLILNVVD